MNYFVPQIVTIRDFKNPVDKMLPDVYTAEMYSCTKDEQDMSSAKCVYEYIKVRKEQKVCMF